MNKGRVVMVLCLWGGVVDVGWECLLVLLVVMWLGCGGLGCGWGEFVCGCGYVR